MKGSFCCEKSGFAVVSSTLPAIKLKKLIFTQKVSHIFFSSHALFNSFRILLLESPHITVTIQRRNPIGIFQLLCLILISKHYNRNIYVFHECCYILFDILCLLFRPYTIYEPIVYMLSFQSIDFDEYKQNTRLFARLCLSFPFLRDKFVYYKSLEDLDTKFYCQSLKSAYYTKLASMPANDTNPLINPMPSRIKSVVLILSKDLFPKEQIESAFACCINIAHRFNATVFVKDHPRPSSRLDLKYSDDVIPLNPIDPIESYIEYFDVFISIASSSLACFNGRGISLLKLLGNNSYLLDSRFLHLNAIDNSLLIKYPENYDQLCSQMRHLLE